ncbi:hypothetical protein L3Q65_46090 [Amycolatopsis sp. FU40]|uniref:hypothetical protein n=1 Tax=Amycolatopsis sp. FU40 TaxID=2914159 RepID=UPI001F1EC4BC|nr:hypothetical protein [Amycolatopsis sp. FU40]UKD55146.1 hypothetical protein L3Q65_46090 [Amycolatopsis sp. FU40]
MRALEAERQRAEELTRQLAAANQKVTEFEQAGMNDLQKAQAERDTAVTDRDTAQRDLARYKAAVEHGVPKDYLHMLTATDDATLKQQAATVQELLAQVNGGQTPPPPAPLPGQGTPQTPTAPTLTAGAALYKSPYQNNQNT